MGNQNAKSADKYSILSKDEIPIVSGSFKSVSNKHGDKVKEEDLMKFWGSQMDPRLAQYITHFLFGKLTSRSATVDFKKFAELYVVCVRGTIDERVSALFASLGQCEAESSEIAYPLIKEYVEAIVSTYMRTIRLQAGQRYKNWESQGYKAVNDCVQKLAENLVYEIVKQGTQKVTRTDIEKWMQTTPTFLIMIEHIFQHLFAYRTKEDSSDSKLKKYEKCLLPEPDLLVNTPQYSPLIDISQITFINTTLPPDYRDKWRFLFSSQIHGESFSTLLGRIINQGSTIFIIEDSNGFMFGGFAPAEWTLSPKFVGDDSSFLFTLKPKMRSFSSTGYNDHFQYLNLHQQTMPNGLGMGGQFDFWGLWLDSDYGNGHSSESCTTFKNYLQMSSDKNFKIKNLEVWGVGELPAKEEEDGSRQKSILDGNHETKAILELAGRKQYSDGYREEDPDE